MWLLWAAWVKANVFAAATYAVTAALILAPMLWELTLRFKVLPASTTAGVLGAFVVGASALAWKGNLLPVIWVANVTAAFTALVLLVATHDLAPFIAALLIMAVASEFAADHNRWLRLRFLVAPTADLAVWILIYIFSLPESARAEYGAVQNALLFTLPSALFLIYGASVTFRTTWLGQRITLFEIAQMLITFLLAAFSWLWFAPMARPNVRDSLPGFRGRLLLDSVHPLRSIARATQLLRVFHLECRPLPGRQFLLSAAAGAAVGIKRGRNCCHCRGRPDGSPLA